jgi:branched-subunit amino acid ABC-type transport system permease component
MEKFLQMMVIGTVVGSMYGFTAFGVVLVYRTTRVLNVAHAGIGVMSGFIAWDLVTVHGLPYYLGLTVAVGAAAVLGFLFDALVLRWMAGQPLLQTGATFVLAIVLAGVTSLPTKWTESNIYELPTPLQGKRYRVPLADHYLTYDQLVLLASLVVFTAATYWMLRRTRPGIALRALADDPSTASILGIRRKWLQRTVWTASFALSGLTTLLVMPMLTLDRTALGLITMKALTAAFVGALVSVPLMAVGALGLGILEAASDLYWTTRFPWLKAALPFLLMVGYLGINTARGRKIVLEDAVGVTG